MIVLSFKVCNKAFVSKYMQTILCLGGVKKSKILFTTPPITLILARISFLVHSSPPLLDKVRGVHAWWKKCLMQGHVMGPMYDLNAGNMRCKNWCMGT